MSEKTKTVRLRATLVAEYDANPENYGTSNPAEMADVDRANWDNDPDGMVFSSFEAEDFTVTVEPVES